MATTSDGTTSDGTSFLEGDSFHIGLGSKPTSKWNDLAEDQRNEYPIDPVNTADQAHATRMESIIMRAKGSRSSRSRRQAPAPEISHDDWLTLFQEAYSPRPKKMNANEVRLIQAYAIRLALTKPDAFEFEFRREGNTHVQILAENAIAKHWFAAHIFFGSPWNVETRQMPPPPPRPPVQQQQPPAGDELPQQEEEKEEEEESPQQQGPDEQRQQDQQQQPPQRYDIHLTSKVTKKYVNYFRQNRYIDPCTPLTAPYEGEDLERSEKSCDLIRQAFASGHGALLPETELRDSHWKKLFLAVCYDDDEDGEGEDIERILKCLSEEDVCFLEDFMWDVAHTNPSCYGDAFSRPETGDKMGYLVPDQRTHQWMGAFLLFGCPWADESLMKTRTERPYIVNEEQKKDLWESAALSPYHKGDVFNAFPTKQLPRLPAFCSNNLELQAHASGLEEHLTTKLDRPPEPDDYKAFFELVVSDGDSAKQQYKFLHGEMGEEAVMEGYFLFIAILGMLPPGGFGAALFRLNEDITKQGFLKRTTLTAQWMGAHLAFGCPWAERLPIEVKPFLGETSKIVNLREEPRAVWEVIAKAPVFNALLPLDRSSEEDNAFIHRVLKSIAKEDPTASRIGKQFFASFFRRAFEDPCRLTKVNEEQRQDLAVLGVRFAKTDPNEYFGENFAVDPDDPDIAYLLFEDVYAAPMWLGAHELFGSPWCRRATESDNVPRTQTTDDNDDNFAHTQDDDDDDDATQPENNDQWEVALNGLPTALWSTLWQIHEDAADLRAFDLKNKSHMEMVKAAAGAFVNNRGGDEQVQLLSVTPEEWKQLFHDLINCKNVPFDHVEISNFKDLGIMLGKCHPRSLKNHFISPADDDGGPSYLSANTVETKMWMGAHLAFGNSFTPIRVDAASTGKASTGTATNPLEFLATAASAAHSERPGHPAGGLEAPSSTVWDKLSPEDQQVAEAICACFAPKATHVTKVIGAGKIAAIFLKVDKLEFLMPRDTEDVQNYDWSTFEFPEVEALRGERGDKLKEGWDRVAWLQNQKTQKALAELGELGDIPNIPCFAVFQKFVRECREVYHDFQLMNSYLCRDDVEKMIIGVFRHKNGSSAASFETTYRSEKSKFFKKLRAKLKVAASTRGSEAAEQSEKSAEAEQTETSAEDEGPTGPTTRSSRKRERDKDDDDDDDNEDGESTEDEEDEDQEEEAEAEIVNSEDEGEGEEDDETPATSAPATKKGRKGRVKGPPKKKSKKDKIPQDASLQIKNLQPPIRMTKKKRGVEYSNPGRLWVKHQQQTLRLIKNFLNSLRADEGIRAPREEWAAVVEDICGGSENGGDHNNRAFVWLVAAVFYLDVKPKNDPDEYVEEILQRLKEKELLRPDAMANAELKDIKSIVHKVNDKYEYAWMKVAAKRILSQPRAMVPSTRDDLLSLTDDTITSLSVSLVLQQAFGFSALPVIDDDCRKVMVALMMADMYEFCDRKGEIKMEKAQREKLEKSLTTWLPNEEYASFHCTLKSFVQVLFMHQTVTSPRKDHAKIIKRVYNKFPEEMQPDLWEIIYRVGLYFKKAQVRGAKQLLELFPSPYEEDQES